MDMACPENPGNTSAQRPNESMGGELAKRISSKQMVSRESLKKKDQKSMT